MKQLRVTLPEAEMAELLAAVEAFVELERKDAAGDYVPMSWLRADAVLEMGRTALAACGTKRAAGVDRYMAHVTIDLDTLLGVEVGTARLRDGTPIDAACARRLACESSIVAHFVRNGYEPIALGRRVQSFTVGQKRAIKVRDHNTCRFPGCARTIVDCHHVMWDSRGGHHDVANGICLCSRHHTEIHRPGWRIEGDANGEIRFFSGVLFRGSTRPPGALPRL